MPNGIYPYRVFESKRQKSSPTRASHPGRGVRFKTWWRRNRLDQQLAGGSDPRGSAELTLRAEQLSSGAERIRLAEALEGALRAALQPVTMTGLLLRRRQAQACADELLALTGRLRDEQPIDLRGAAMTALLLSDGSGPLYYERANVPLRQAVRSARLALDGVDRPASPASRPLPDRDVTALAERTN